MEYLTIKMSPFTEKIIAWQVGAIVLSGHEKSLFQFITNSMEHIPSLLVPVAARSKAQVFGRSPAETVGSNPTQGLDVCLLWVLFVVR